MEEGPGQPRLPHRSRQALLLRPVHPGTQDCGRQVHRQHAGGLPRERACGLASKMPRSAQAKGAACAHARGEPLGGEVLGRQDKGLSQKHQAVRHGRDQRNHRSPPNSRTTKHRVGIMAAHEF